MKENVKKLENAYPCWYKDDRREIIAKKRDIILRKKQIYFMEPLNESTYETYKSEKGELKRTIKYSRGYLRCNCKTYSIGGKTKTIKIATLADIKRG